ncbi:hypothetical protein [uncultured Bradyrhizobium sp.]|uniref:hypothetical protein n=1 Tax=uncultured Bradyrhizobium sp. TaxID=199684 RepID=UPI0026327F73|nr:hypothetical protein [uncultured Bradyrhizobium sp.]
MERFKARFPAIFRNFAGQTAHIPQGLSSEQFCVLRIDRNQHAVVAGLDPAIHALLAAKNVDARDIGERKRRRPSDGQARA